MNYRLAVLTHGDSAPLDETLWSFASYVEPWPSSIRVFADGAAGPDRVLDAFDNSWPRIDERARPSVAVTHPSRALGFCGATQRLWADSAGAAEPYVFWLEHDFRFFRELDLDDLAAVLEANALLAQIALVRNAVNYAEQIAGGLVESRPGEFEPRDGTWLHQRSYFTTNPSLMRTAFLRANPWPTYSAFCEGRFGDDLVGRGYSFGAWGDGTPWVEHFGVRTGQGY